MSWKGYENFKRFKILVAGRSNSPSSSGRSITRTDLVAYRTELEMSWDGVHSRRLFKHGEIPTSCYDIEGDFSRVPTTPHEFTTTFLRVSASSYDFYRRDVV